jgi:hypothetical protein
MNIVIGDAALFAPGLGAPAAARAQTISVHLRYPRASAFRFFLGAAR